MKRFILTLLCFLAFCVNTQAQMLVGCVGGGVSAAVSCTTVQTPTETGETTTTYSNVSSTQRMVATRFVAAADSTICAIDLYLSKIGTPSDTMTIVAHIYSDNGGTPQLPSSSLGNSTTTIYGKDLGEEAAVKFSGLSVPLTTGTSYWIVGYTNEYHADNRIGIAAESGGAVEEVAKWDGSNWSQLATTRTLKYVLYK